MANKQPTQEKSVRGDPFADHFRDVCVVDTRLVHLSEAKALLFKHAFKCFYQQLKDVFTGVANADPDFLQTLMSPPPNVSTNLQCYQALGEELIIVHASYLLMLLATLHEEIVFFIHPGQYPELLANYEEVSIKVLNHQGKIQTLQIKRYTGTKYPHWLGKAFMCGETIQRAMRKTPQESMEWVSSVYSPIYPVSSDKGMLAFNPPPEDFVNDGFLDEVRRSRLEAFSFLQNSNGNLPYFHSSNQWSLSYLFAGFVQRELQLLLCKVPKPADGENLLTCMDQHTFLDAIDQYRFVSYMVKLPSDDPSVLELLECMKTWEIWERICDVESIPPPTLKEYSGMWYALFSFSNRREIARRHKAYPITSIFTTRGAEVASLSIVAQGKKRLKASLLAESQMMEGVVPPAPPAPTPQDTRVGLNPPVEEMMASNSIDTSAADLLPSALNPSLIKAGGVLVDLKAMIYGRFINLGEPIVFDYQQSHGKCIASISYGPDCFNPYGKIYSNFHRRFAGDFIVQLRVIGAAMFRGCLQVAVFEDKRASAADYNIVDGQRFQDHLLNANSTGSISYRLKFTHKNLYYWETAADLAGSQQTIAVMVYIGLINPFANEGSNVQFQMLTRCAENFIFALPTTISSNVQATSVVVPSDRLVSFIGKTVRQLIEEEVGQVVDIAGSANQHQTLRLFTDGRQYPCSMFQKMDFFKLQQRISWNNAYIQRISITGGLRYFKRTLGSGRPTLAGDPAYKELSSYIQGAYQQDYDGDFGVCGPGLEQWWDPREGVEDYDMSQTTIKPYVFYRKDGAWPATTGTVHDAFQLLFPSDHWMREFDNEFYYDFFSDTNQVVTALLEMFPGAHISYLAHIPKGSVQFFGYTTTSVAWYVTGSAVYESKAFGAVVPVDMCFDFDNLDPQLELNCNVYKIVSGAGTGYLYINVLNYSAKLFQWPLRYEYLQEGVGTAGGFGTLIWDKDGQYIQPPPGQDRIQQASQNLIFPTRCHLVDEYPDLYGEWIVPSIVDSQYQNLPSGFLTAGFAFDIPYPVTTGFSQVGHDPTVMSLLVRAIKRKAPEVDGVVDLSLVNPDFGIVVAVLRINMNTGAAFVNTNLTSTDLERFAHAVYAADADKLYVSLAAIKQTGQFLPQTDVETWLRSDVAVAENILEGMTTQQLEDLSKSFTAVHHRRTGRTLAMLSVEGQAMAGAVVGGGLLSGLGEGLGALGNMYYQQQMQQNMFSQQQLLQSNMFGQQEKMAYLNSDLWLNNQQDLALFKSNLLYQDKIKYQNLAGNLTPAAQAALGTEARKGQSPYVSFNDVIGESSTDDKPGGFRSVQPDGTFSRRTSARSGAPSVTSDTDSASDTQSELSAEERGRRSLGLPQWSEGTLDYTSGMTSYRDPNTPSVYIPGRPDVFSQSALNATQSNMNSTVYNTTADHIITPDVRTAELVTRDDVPIADADQSQLSDPREEEPT